MDLRTFRQIVDRVGPVAAACDGDPQRISVHFGLDKDSVSTSGTMSDILYARIRSCFVSGHASVWQMCRSLQTLLIREQVLLGIPMDPYFEVLDHLRDAIRGNSNSGEPIRGDWERAIGAAVVHVQIHRWGAPNPNLTYARDFMVAQAALALRDAGFPIRPELENLRLEDTAEAALIATIEELIAEMGGINVARRIFDTISPDYDAEQERYHVVQQPSMQGGGEPQMPWGYLIQLAVKHARGNGAYANTEAQWNRLRGLSMAFAAMIDVQPYTPTFYATMDAKAIVPHLRAIAVYDTMFRIPQMRSADVTKLATGVLSWLDINKPTTAGWSINQVLEVIRYLLNPVRDRRGPFFVDESDILRSCPGLPRQILTKILDEILSHPLGGANRNFSRPTDAPVPEDPELKNVGHDFFLRPLLRHSGRRFIVLDRSVCAPACLEALFAALRLETRGFDDKVGIAAERFLEAEFISHGVRAIGGNYTAGGENGECDLVIDSPEKVIFIEVKKKTLTRRARAGSDAHLLADFAGSLLAAQAQAGWHEVRLRQHGHLHLDRDGVTTTIELGGRDIERVAVSLLDFGSFQDRIVLKQFLEATMYAQFTPADEKLDKKFKEMNQALAEIREQVQILHKDEQELKQPFFNCWFVSVPQLLVCLDGVTDSASFKDVLWSCRHIVTGRSDLYFDLSYVKRLKGQAVTG